MGGAFLITLREGLEAALIVAIVMAYLRQLGRADQFRWVAAGVLAGVGVSLVAGAGVYLAVGELEGKAEEFTEGIIEANASGAYGLPRAKIWLFTTPRPGELLCNATRLIGRDGRALDPTDPEDLTEAELAGRAQVREYARFFRDRLPGCEASFVNDTGVQVGVRQTRSITGVQTLTNDDVVSHCKRADGIARSPWPIELHAGEKPKLEWLLDDYYEVPWQALLPAIGEHLVVAGRCLSAEHEALASARVTAQCFCYGHAAGLAAATAVARGESLRSLSGEELRHLLNADGARLEE